MVEFSKRYKQIVFSFHILTYSTLAKFMKQFLLPTEMVLKTEN